MSAPLALGLDFGTESARAVLLEVDTGVERGSAVCRYAHGVLDRSLPTGESLPALFALQHPGDWLAAMESAARGAMAAARVRGGDVVGIGVGFTACTVLPCRADGTPLCLDPDLERQPHAWPKLWKHHAAQPQADAVNALAHETQQPWLARYGGQLSCEWLLPKVLELAEEAPDLHAGADVIVEAGDWIVWQLTGELVRNACAAGFKGTWSARDGHPPADFLARLHPALADHFATRGAGPVVAPGVEAGTLSPTWAARLGLRPDVHVAAAIIDAHAGAIGAGATDHGTLYLATGTSTCHLLNAPDEVFVPGIAGVVEDGIVAGAFGYEAGQAAVGDLFAWQVRQSGRSHAELTEEAATLRAGETGLLAIDWFNGSRTPYMDAGLTGAVLGMTLATTPAHVYRALIDASAYGTRAIVDALVEAGAPVGGLVAGGGLTASALVMQVYADVLGRRLEICESEHPTARGAAVLGAVAAGAHPSTAAAAQAMAPPRRAVEPDAAEAPVHDELYAEYRALAQHFADARQSPLRRLTAIRSRTDIPPVEIPA